MDVLGSKAVAVLLPEREPGCDAVGAIEYLAGGVGGRDCEAVVVALLGSLAVCLHASNFALDARHSDVEEVVAALATAASLPVLHLPGPVFIDWLRVLASDRAGDDGRREKSECGEGNHCEDGGLVDVRIGKCEEDEMIVITQWRRTGT